ncbi:MAG TPA: hypothetical protein VGO03_17590 [Acidimicrobiia bacterium]
MRVASVVTPVVAALLASFAAGCSSSSASSFCSTLTSSKLDFSQVTAPAKELGTLDQLIAKLSPTDRRLVLPVRQYVAVLYQQSSLTKPQQTAFLKHFFRVDAPALDQRLRKDCNVSLAKRIDPFPFATKGN